MILTYHEIVPEPCGYVYSRTVSHFAEHMMALRMLNEDIRRPMVTFDDGHSSHHRYALPVLDHYQHQATFFVTVGWTGTMPEYMGWEQLRDLANRGHEVQSHGWSHAMLTRCSRHQLIEELHRSRLTLEDGLNRAVDAISIPGGRWDDRILAACAEEGYRRVFTSDPYFALQSRYGVMVAGRAMIRRSQGVRELLSLLRSEQTRLSIERARCVTKKLFHSVLGDDVYHQLWRRIGASRQRSAINRAYTAPPG
jgi:peptidoglycan/xylan/chitin deacetylase (PgdA/CDA1 family)